MNRTANNAIKVKYDGMNNITYECLKRGVIYADIGFDKADLVMDIVPARHYEGKTPNGEAKIGFVISIKFNSVCPELQNKVVFEIDGERMEMEASEERISKHSYRAFDEECNYSLEEIMGINGYAVNNTVYFNMMFDLQPKDIQRIAEAKNVCIYFDSNGEYNVNGGTIALRNGNGSCQIEGIQRAMKRAYYYFVDFANSDEDAELKKAQEAYDNKDYKTALYIWNQLAERNNAEAFFNIGNCFYNGQGVNRDYTEAKNWFMQAGELGDARAFMCLADFSESPAKAVEWWLKAAELGDAEACRNLAVFYETKNISETIKWCQKAMDNGYDDEDGIIGKILSRASNPVTLNPEAIFENAWAEQINEKCIGLHFKFLVNNCLNRNIKIVFATRSLTKKTTNTGSSEFHHWETTTQVGYLNSVWNDFKFFLKEDEIEEKLAYCQWADIEIRTEVSVVLDNVQIGGCIIEYIVHHVAHVLKPHELLLIKELKWGVL